MSNRDCIFCIFLIFFCITNCSFMRYDYRYQNVTFVVIPKQFPTIKELFLVFEGGILPFFDVFFINLIFCSEWYKIANGMHFYLYLKNKNKFIDLVLFLMLWIYLYLILYYFFLFIFGFIGHWRLLVFFLLNFCIWA